MAIGRLNRPSILVYGGTIKSGNYKGKSLNIVSAFEAYGEKITGKINEKDVSVDAIKKSEIIFLEGYLWDEGEPKQAFDKAINNANKVAMSLSDLFCVDRHLSLIHI